MALTEKSESRLAAELDQVIFLDFLGYFLIAILFSGEGRSVRWRWPPRHEDRLRLGGYLLLIVVGGWFMAGLAGWGFTLFWMLGLVMSLSDVPSLRSGAILRVAWGVVSAFSVALAGSIGGVPEEKLFRDHAPTLLGWALLYFGGVLLFRLVRIFSTPSRK